jgi:Tol biopolymer transport system component
MTWTPGTKIGPYEIIGPLGAGGMGEVHRARDTRLDREVAIKVIPAASAGDEQLRQRFEREARAISALNHPHICTLYDVGQAPAGPGAAGDLPPLHYLVMELLDGESLADRLEKGPLPVPETLRIGAQIAAALDAAHRQGIIHRDLKPGNVMLTRTGAKLLDFGLARTAVGGTAPIGAPAPASSRQSTALAQGGQPLTAQGTILGTFQYMAPEQLEGIDADARTDIFALGAVLYEMATGRRAFEGGSKTSLIAAIVSAQPAPIASVMPMSPPALDHVVRRCLEKDPEARWQSARDVAVELQWIAEAGSQAGVPAPVTGRRRSREALAWGAAAVLGVAAAVLAVAHLARQPAPASRPFRATLMPPAGQALIPFDTLGLSLSPDGGTLAFVAVAGDGRGQIWLRALAGMEASAVPETTGAQYPFWSPDGRALGFFAEGKLKVIDLRGGSPRVLADAPTGRGGTWSGDGTILFAPNITSPILSVPAAGGPTAPVTTYDPQTELTHRWPVFLPDGRHFIYLSRGRGGGHGELGRLMLATLGDPRATVLIEDASNALYVEPGCLIYGRSGTLYAWRFDAAARRLEGQPAPIVPDRMSYWEPKNYVPFAASGDGTLVYLPEDRRMSEMRWYDRHGLPLGTLGPPGFYRGPRVSRDGRRVAYLQGDGPQSPVNLWIRDLDTGRDVRITQQGGLYLEPCWTPRSDRIAFVCQPQGTQDICVISSQGMGEQQLLYASGTWKDLGSWMPDGRRLLFARQDPDTNNDIMMLSAEGGEPTPVLRTPFAEEAPAACPDGIRLAYESNESGRIEVYLRNLEGPAGQWQVSTDGGLQPRWRGDGRELFYAGADGTVMAANVPPGAGARPGVPVRLFAMPERPDYQTLIFEDVTPDGQRILLNVPTTSRTSIGFQAIRDWPALMRGADSAQSSRLP